MMIVGHYVFGEWAEELIILIITLRAKLRGTVYCNRSSLFCLFVGLRVCLWSVTTVTRNCVHRSSPNWVCR